MGAPAASLPFGKNDLNSTNAAPVRCFRGGNGRNRGQHDALVRATACDKGRKSPGQLTSLTCSSNAAATLGTFMRATSALEKPSRRCGNDVLRNGTSQGTPFESGFGSLSHRACKGTSWGLTDHNGRVGFLEEVVDQRLADGYALLLFRWDRMR